MASTDPAAAAAAAAKQAALKVLERQAGDVGRAKGLLVERDATSRKAADLATQYIDAVTALRRAGWTDEQLAGFGLELPSRRSRARRAATAADALAPDEDPGTPTDDQ